MRIGILTFHRAHNYGAMLQAFALRKVLVKKGYEVEFISYRQPKIEDAYKPFMWTYTKNNSIAQNFKNLLSAFLTFYRRVKRRSVFLHFAQKYLPESKKYLREDLLRVKLNYDVVFFGSDQIWTTRFMGDFDDIYWGEINLKDGRKIAYAPSMELKTISEKEKTYISEHINLFDSISAREVNMSHLLENLTKKTVKAVVDPTLLCKADDYVELIAFSKRIPKEPYVLVYQVGHYSIVNDIAKEVAKQLECQIIEIGSEILLHNNATYKDIYGPEDFVALIANAKFVVSCSFHGTAFSVNFHRPFYSVLIPGIDSRATSFLSQVGLMQCGIRCLEDVNAKLLLDLDFNKVDIELDKMRDSSMEYINKSLR